MKILLDENIDVRLRFAFDDSGHDVMTVKFMGWSGIKNGQLLSLMDAHNFDVFIAVDKNLPYQQNTERLPVTIFILDVVKNVLLSVKPFAPVILDHLSKGVKKEVIVLQLV